MEGNYFWDKRSGKQVENDFNVGKENERRAMAAIKEYCEIFPGKQPFHVLSYEELGGDEEFYADGRGRPYNPDFRVKIQNIRTGLGPIRIYWAELKTTPYTLNCDIWVKKSQLDNLARRFGKMGLVIVSDPVKFAIKDVLSYINQSFIKEIKEIGGKECYLIKYSYLHWIQYNFAINFIQKERDEKQT